MDAGVGVDEEVTKGDKCLREIHGYIQLKKCSFMSFPEKP